MDELEKLQDRAMEVAVEAGLIQVEDTVNCAIIPVSGDEILLDEHITNIFEAEGSLKEGYNEEILAWIDEYTATEGWDKLEEGIKAHLTEDEVSLWEDYAEEMSDYLMYDANIMFEYEDKLDEMLLNQKICTELRTKDNVVYMTEMTLGEAFGVEKAMMQGKGEIDFGKDAKCVSLDGAELPVTSKDTKIPARAIDGFGFYEHADREQYSKSFKGVVSEKQKEKSKDTGR